MEETSEQNCTEATWHLLEAQRPFSQSVLWDLQHLYFAQKGVEAWRQGEVPHYVSSNPTVAKSYAEIVFAFWCDQNRLAPGDRSSTEPVYLCELGAGSGRFAFHFLTRLTRLCEQASVATTAFCYVLTDFAQSNLDFWCQHPGFQAFFESGMLDVGLFDITHSEQLALQRSGKTISAGSLACPLVVIANYVWDSIPQDLFYMEKGSCSHCLVSLIVDADPSTLTVAELLARLRYRYDYQRLDEAAYQEPYLQQLLADYQRTLIDTHLLFPAVGLRCLERLQRLSKHGLLLLSADKGDHRLSALQGRSAPRLVQHGSFSLSVNYHAFKAFCEHYGGMALLPGHSPSYLTVGCFFLLDNAMAYSQTQHAYHRSVEDFGPDDFYTISKYARQHIVTITLEEILAYMRLSSYDSHLFAHYLPRLLELAPAWSQEEQQELFEVVEQVWASYFPLGEATDLADQIACLCYVLDDYPRALTYFARSVETYGPHSGTLCNMAVCHRLLGQHEQAKSLLHVVVHSDPENQAARALWAHYQPAEE